MGQAHESVEFQEATGVPPLADRPLVLIVDDSQTIRLIVKQIVAKAGYQVIEASTATDALRIVHEHRPALVISDALMPMLDGREMCRMIKKDPALSNIKVVLMSGLYTSNRYRLEAMTTFGADGYLSKPVRTEQFRAMLHRFAPIDQVA